MTERELCAMALHARQSAYAPYSGCRVGAALLAASGAVYCGCNVENASYSATLCAERTAFVKAVSEGERKFVQIAIAGGCREDVTAAFPPCGACRQVMAEFCQPDFSVLLVTGPESYRRCTLRELLPLSFERSALEPRS